MAADGWADERARTAAALGNRSAGPSGRRAGGDRAYGDAGADAATSATGRKRGGIMPVTASLVILAGFAGAVWFAYTQGLEQGRHTEIPLVRADTSPIKMKPEDPGGLQVPNQDKLVLNQDEAEGESLRVERLLPEPETPQRPEPPQGEPPAAAESLTGAPAETPAEPPAGEQLAEAPVTEAGPPAASEVEAPLAEAPSGAVGGDGDREQVAQAALLEPGAVVIQLASVGSTDAAEREWHRLQGAFPDLLGDMELAVQEVTVNGKLYHRMQTGPFPNRATAEDMCAQLKAKQQACLVTKR